MKTDCLIVGAGLGGTAIALQLAAKREVLLVDSGGQDSASQAAVIGLINPIMARRPKPVHEADRAMAAALRLLEVAGCQITEGILRPATIARQAKMYRKAAAIRPDFASWIEPAEARVRFPWIEAPEGVLEITAGRSVSVPDLLNAMRTRLIEADGVIRSEGKLVSWREEDDRVIGVFDTPSGKTEVSARLLVIAVGSGYHEFEALRALALHRIKGQLVRVRVEQAPEGVRAVSGKGYVVPEGEGRFIIGSSYEHEYEDTAPRRVVSRRLLATASRELPWLEGAEIRSEFAGIRVTVPKTRLPMVGPLPDHRHTWLLSGLSSKGLLLAPLIAEGFSGWLARPEDIPADYQVRPFDGI